MPMFPTPQPRRFQYKPRFYDPDKEEWELTKLKYGYSESKEKEAVAHPRNEELMEGTEQEQVSALRAEDSAKGVSSELDYFEQRLRELDEEDRKKRSKLTVKDLFRKRKMPTFTYQPRFAAQEVADADSDEPVRIDRKGQEIMERMRRHRMGRRFDFDDDDYLKPIPATRIFVYAFIVLILIWWVMG